MHRALPDRLLHPGPGPNQRSRSSGVALCGRGSVDGRLQEAILWSVAPIIGKVTRHNPGQCTFETSGIPGVCSWMELSGYVC